MGYPTNYQQPHIPYNPDDEVRRQNRIKAYVWIGIFIMIHTTVITILGLITTNVKIRLGDIDGLPETNSLEMRFAAQVRFRNKNWGSYRYEDGIAIFMYEGVPIGQLVIPGGKVGMRSTKTINAIGSVSSGFWLGNTMFGTEQQNSEILVVTSTAKLDGRVEFMGIFQKHRTAYMEYSLATETAQNTPECSMEHCPIHESY